APQARRGGPGRQRHRPPPRAPGQQGNGPLRLPAGAHAQGRVAEVSPNAPPGPRARPGPCRAPQGWEPMTAPNNPSLPGDCSFAPVIYASAGLNYAAVPALNQYAIYDAPDPAYVTGRVNISAFADLGFSAPWPFANTAVPLNGHIRIPRGRGPFPLA